LTQYVCTGSNSIFQSNAACLSSCAAYPITGTLGDTVGDTLQCRFYHVSVAAQSAQNAIVHCPHASPLSVAGVCAAPPATPAAGGCPSTANFRTFQVQVKAKTQPFTGYPTGFTVDGALQGQICLNPNDCAVFVVNTPDCFHPFYVDQDPLSQGGNGLGNAINDTNYLASTNNYACTAGSATNQMSMYIPLTGYQTAFTYQCRVHKLMGGSIIIQTAACPAPVTPSPSPTTTGTITGSVTTAGTTTTSTSTTSTNSPSATTTAGTGGNQNSGAASLAAALLAYFF